MVGGGTMRNMRSKLLFIFSSLFICILFSSTSIAFASGTSGYAWNENTGWIDFSQVTVSSSALSGYAYSPNIGWISLNCSNTSSCGTAEYGVTNSNGTLSGYAWSENTGWVDFGGVTVNTSNGVFSGYAYSPNIGWISLNCSNTASCGTVDYKVTTSWRPPAPAPVSVSSGSISGGRAYVCMDPKATNYDTYPADGNISCHYATVAPVTTPPTTPLPLLTTLPSTPPSVISAPSSTIRTLKLGMTGDDVKALQVYLNAHNFSVTVPGKETKYFGSKTKKAVQLFQKAHDLKTDGSVGPKTWSVMSQLPASH